jgi:tripeptide aminopeptidase
MLSKEMRVFLREEAKSRFLRYVQIDTESNPSNEVTPSSENEWDLARLLLHELKDMGIQDAELDEFCYVYAKIPATKGVNSPAISFIAHMDTAPGESGKNVKPIIHKKYDGSPIIFPDKPGTPLTPEEAPSLLKYIGEDIITASGLTLLGADDKAGVAEIMAALSLLKKYPDLPHPELRICFTPDEEVGAGTAKIKLNKLGKFAYTLDGSEIGELEDECFNAYSVKLHFIGKNVHPGYSKNVMINAGAIASRFIAALPEQQTPEHTAKREGFFHLVSIGGDPNDAHADLILRDFEEENNLKRVKLIKNLISVFELLYPGLKIEIKTKNNYCNMREVLHNYPEVIGLAEEAFRAADIEPKREPIRGGTDGARLCFMGIPAPNIFAGGLMFHSKKEWIPIVALEKGAEVIIHLCRLWAQLG